VPNVEHARHVAACPKAKPQTRVKLKFIRDDALA